MDTGVRLVPLVTVAQDLGVCPATLRRWIKEGLRPRPVRLGRGLFYEAGDVRQLVENAREPVT